ncbi:37158_t:CDS:1, partial [Gigaspora margarita]
NIKSNIKSEYTQQLIKFKTAKPKILQIGMKAFLNDIKVEILEELLPEIDNNNLLEIEAQFRKLTSYNIQALVKYKKKIQNIMQPL